MLDRVSFPLTRAQIDAFILEKEYTNYLTLQQAIGELCDIHLISTKTVHNRTQLMLTEEGRSTLSFFRNNIPEAIKKDIDLYLKENAMELRNEVSITGQYYKTINGSYQTLLSATEHDDLLMELKLNVPDEKTAAAICNHWQQKNESVYALLIKELF
jgi:hypothetical protein